MTSKGIIVLCLIAIYGCISSLVQGQTCYPPPTVDSSTLSPNLASYTTGAIVTYTCNAYHALSGNQQLTCINSGGTMTWNQAPPSCDIYNCTLVTPTSVAQASYQWSPPYTGGDKIMYSCNTNYVISGNTEVTCDTGPAWSGSLPTCTRVCAPPDPVTNGYLTNPAENYYSNVYARFRCNTNHIMSGDPYRQCGTDYTWKGNGPTCTSQTQSQLTNQKESRVYADPNGGVAGVVSNSQVGVSGTGVNTTNTTTEETGNKAGSSDWLIVLIILAILLALLLLALLLFCLMKLCCCGQWCNLCGPGSSCSRCGACCTGCFGQGKTAGYDESESGKGCCGCCKKKKPKPALPPQPPPGQRHHQHFYPPPSHNRQYPPKQTEYVTKQTRVFKQKPDQNDPPRHVEKTKFQLAVERVMGKGEKKKQPKKIQGKWMPHSHEVRNIATSTK